MNFNSRIPNMVNLKENKVILVTDIEFLFNQFELVLNCTDKSCTIFKPRFVYTVHTYFGGLHQL